MWRSLVSLASRPFLRLSFRSPPAPAMFSALARPAGAALRRSFSTSAQVGRTTGPRASLDRRVVEYRPAPVAPWAGRDTGRAVRRESPGEGGGKPPSPGSSPRTPQRARPGSAQLQGWEASGL